MLLAYGTEVFNLRQKYCATLQGSAEVENLRSTRCRLVRRLETSVPYGEVPSCIENSELKGCSRCGSLRGGNRILRKKNIIQYNKYDYRTMTLRVEEWVRRM